MDTRTKLTLIAACVCGLQLSACSSGSPPRQELQISENTINQAIASGAEEVAPKELLNAQNKLSKAHRLIKKKKYKDAKGWLAQATVDAKLALRTTEASKAKDEARLLSAQTVKLQEEISDRETQLQMTQQELEAFKELQAKQTDRGMVLTLGDVLFNIDESSLNDGAMAKMDRIAAFMQRYPERTITIEGHTDNTGDNDYNQNLSLNRATAVLTALQSRNIGSNRISTRGMGEVVPIADNNSDYGRQQNRRVEIIFSNQKSTLSEFDY